MNHHDRDAHLDSSGVGLHILKRRFLVYVLVLRRRGNNLLLRDEHHLYVLNLLVVLPLLRARTKTTLKTQGMRRSTPRPQPTTKATARPLKGPSAMRARLRRWAGEGRVVPVSAVGMVSVVLVDPPTVLVLVMHHLVVIADVVRHALPAQLALHAAIPNIVAWHQVDKAAVPHALHIHGQGVLTPQGQLEHLTEGVGEGHLLLVHEGASAGLAARLKCLFHGRGGRHEDVVDANVRDVAVAVAEVGGLRDDHANGGHGYSLQGLG
ncbi:hypothetical protein HWV62_626 [Athelia sp. TMB]|nr:hypothetical protein HWV62_626 [Athelia sp. TMB]